MWGRPARQCRKAEHREPGSWVRTEEDRHQLGKGPHQAQGRGLYPVVTKGPLEAFREQRMSPVPSGSNKAPSLTICVALAPVSLSFPFWLL